MGNPCVCKEQPSSRWVFHAPKPFCLSPLCCLGYISWWDVSPTWIGTFFAHMQTHTQVLVQPQTCTPHAHCYTHTDTHKHTYSRQRLAFSVQRRVIIYVITDFGQILKCRKCEKQRVGKSIGSIFSFRHKELILLKWFVVMLGFTQNPLRNRWNLIILWLEYFEWHPLLLKS